MNRPVPVVALLLICGLAPNAALAQGSGEVPWGPGTTLSVFGGIASSGSAASGVAGASLGWELTPYFAIEGSGAWVAKSRGGQEFAALLGPRVSLLSPRMVVPSLFVGVGMMRASVDVDDARLPEFYGRRLEAPAGLRTEVFQDLALAVGGGADISLNHRLTIRPDVRVLFARAASDTRALALIGVHMTYHFEPRPYLP